ncbi:hypothetical protein HYH03_008171 [Edaphochlamys debaryana]|uniref:Gamma-tubulin complex component n=1 Tax=Edaphochlamys debaryana TaxID=47281 RepID=A0A835Y3X0_9CHLO|nr:hypothetical protein HYH03_008171 [Edaphochlamys debaryana]|eukprot:KAG2493656.1 hypothetical protein HYH03_008171 [Edaphochlamys debaryana]
MVKLTQEVVPFDESGLLLELLFALVGHHGDLFVDDADRDDKDDETWQLPRPDECTVHISEQLTWISESDREVLADLMLLSFHFKAVSTFVEWEHAPWDPHQRTRPPSVYRRALASGLTELLDDYRCTLHGVARQLGAEPAPALPSLKHHMWEYMDVLPALHSLVWAQEAHAHGPAYSPAALVNALAEGSRSGLPGVRQVMGRLLWHCNQVLMQQMAAWMIHGMLQDPNREFFINPRTAAQAQHAAHSTQGPGQAQQREEEAGATGGESDPLASAYAFAGADRPGAGAGAGDEGAGAAGGSGRDQDEAAYREWHGGFQVNPRALPLYVSHDLADTVLFVGRAVRVLRRPAGPGGGGGGGGGGPGELLPLHEMMQFGQAFTALQAEPELSVPRLEMLVEALRAHVARLLWRQLVGRAGLLPALCALKDYLLLGRGDFWQTFLEEARGLMAAPPRPTSADADLAVPFARSAAKTSAEGDPLLPAFALHRCTAAEAEQEFMIRSSAAPHPVPPLDPAWDPLVLRVGLDWPLGLLLGADQLRRYNQLFALLLRLRRMQGGLEEAWQALRTMDRELMRTRSDGRQRPRGQPPGAGAAAGAGAGGALHMRMRELQELRNHMAHLVANLQIYIQTDVIEASFSALEDRISTCQDFSELERAHHGFLSTLMTQSFLTVRSLCAILGDVFADVRTFCQLVARCGCDPARIDPAALAKVRADFLRHAGALYNNISSQRMIDSFRAPHLAQLVTRLNYNDWYSLRGQPA